MFFVFESTQDKMGKTTQIDLVAQHLSSIGYKVLKTKEPGATFIGGTIRELLLHTDKQMNLYAELLLFLADRAQHVHETILPALKEGYIVLSDRYVYSTLMYQGYGREIDLSFIKNIHEKTTNNLYPDLTFLFVGSPFLTDQEDRLEKETETFKQKAKNGILQIAKNDKSFVLVQANNEKEKITDFIVQHIQSHIKQHYPSLFIS
ncbi:MAG: dTMP kinase [Ignavibacterium sp.]|nr:dTMP kinase [Ignavibacterium sp.]